MIEIQRHKEMVKSSLEQTLKMYTECTPIRAAIAAIPWVGGPFDVLLSGEGARVQNQRINGLLDDLSERLGKLEAGYKPEPGDELWDLLVRTFEGVARERSDEKRKRFASIIVKQVEKNGDMGEAIDAVDMLRDLSEIHIEVLMAALNAPTCKDLFEGDQVVALSGPPKADLTANRPLPLDQYLSGYDNAMIRIACAQLVAKGLMQDHGVGKLSTPGMFYFVLTDAGKWFVDWILEEDEP